MYKVTPEEHSPINPSGFRWMPAAVDMKNHGGLGCYVRYKRYQDKPVVVRHKSANRILLECPDRDLLLVRDQHYFWPYKPTEGVWDEFVNFSPFWANAQRDNDLHYWMLNYTEYIGTDAAPRLRQGRPRAPHENFIVSDSGGFQLAMGRLDWVDPVEVVKWYNDNVDLGMVLDIPTLNVNSKKDFLTIARAQEKNTRLMLDHKNENLELLNIFHGHDLEWTREFRKVVETPEIDRLAIGGAYYGTLMNTLDQVFGIIEDSRDHYKHYHVLGVWNLLQLIPMMRYASHGRTQMMTSDSSTPVQNANAKRYAYHPAINDIWQLYPIGTHSPTMHVNHHQTLPCRCQVCSTMKYMDALAVLPGALMTHTLVYHNVYAMNNYVKMMEPIVKEASVQDLTDLMLAQTGNRRGIHEAKWGLQLADEIAKNGYTAARKKFSTYILQKDGVDEVSEGSLFAPVEGDGDASDTATEDEGVLSFKVRLAERYLSDNPEDKGVHGKEVKTAVKGFQVNVAKSSKRQSGKDSMKKTTAKAAHESRVAPAKGEATKK